MEPTDFVTPVIVIALFLWLGRRMDAQGKELCGRIDALAEQMAQVRERMARLEGFLEGLRAVVAGRADRDHARPARVGRA